MTHRNPTKSVNAFLPLIDRITHDTVTLGTGDTLASHFSAEEVAAAEIAWITPHAADAWLLFGGVASPGTNDGHRIALGETRELAMQHLDEVLITGSGAATITLFKYSGPE